MRGVDQWMCFDACPVHACLPHVARRLKAVTPDAKIVVMLRNPVQGVFSAEVGMVAQSSPIHPGAALRPPPRHKMVVSRDDGCM